MRQPAKNAKRKIYWIVIAVLIIIFIGVNYLSIKDKRAELQKKQAVAKKTLASSNAHPLTFSVAPPSAQAVAPVKYFVQVATVDNRSTAQSWQEHLTKLGHHSHLETIQTGHVTHYRIQLGPYAHEAQAMEEKKSLEKQGVSSLIVKS